MWGCALPDLISYRWKGRRIMSVTIDDARMAAVHGDRIIAVAERWSPESDVWTVPIDRSGPLWSAPLGWSTLMLDRNAAITALSLAERVAAGASQNDPHVVCWWDEIIACHDRMMSAGA